ncbi:uncharacterized protein B0H18DRAFT_246224 [Fomitopsis serialis]|uniref:uncharacterized protein n=1 Tax=Fomitopsis serialis TaxID=139415 RepID=UPI002007FD78|nr:uncharacterized protein B0H18DRAFT_246224 [Neoantrodia serialis]KAH9928702.1 hypothetical protein B0H18DRAFT_246224 [Neoantrodia serialis]
MHRPKKSLSQVSLALAGLPNVSAGPPMARSANPSIGSAMTTGTGFGSTAGLSGDDMSTQTHELSLLQPPHPHSAHPVPGPAHTGQPSAAVEEAPRRSVEQERPVEARQPRATDKPPLTERSARRLSGFPVFEEDRDAVDKKQEPGEVRPRDIERRPTHTIAMLTSTRPLTIISSRAASPEQNTPDNSFQLLERPPSPPRSHSRNTIPSIPAPSPPRRTPSPDRQRPSYRNSPLPPPPSDSPPQFYLSPIPPSTDRDVIQPAPLPRSPPQHSEPPTPLPLPTPRAKSPAPPVPHPHSRPREARDAVPTVIRNETTVEHAVSTRPGTPPMEGRQRRREPIRDERRSRCSRITCPCRRCGLSLNPSCAQIRGQRHSRGGASVPRRFPDRYRHPPRPPTYRSAITYRCLRLSSTSHIGLSHPNPRRLTSTLPTRLTTIPELSLLLRCRSSVLSLPHRRRLTLVYDPLRRPLASRLPLRGMRPGRVPHIPLRTIIQSLVDEAAINCKASDRCRGRRRHIVVRKAHSLTPDITIPRQPRLRRLCPPTPSPCSTRAVTT